MNLPQILIEFKSKAQSIIQRSERGVVAVILKTILQVRFHLVFIKV